MHSSGLLLVTCRWDERGEAEGDASNEQALYVSADDGVTWRMANGGRPIVTLADGTSFDRVSAITHSFAFEDSEGQTYLYYTINQPWTWGAGRPDRATGGGEIRRIRIEMRAGEWVAVGPSDVVWGFLEPVDNGRGGTRTDVRLLCLNGILRLRDGRLLMPVGGRTTVPEPEGAFWPLDRCWALESTDDGQTWDRSTFIGGGPALCLCEPTIVETARDGHLVALMRSQYDTGFELYRSNSFDGGRTWSPPRATGLPNTGGSGVKPYLIRRWDGTYALLQTYEHLSPDRTAIAVLITDEEGLERDHWPVKKVLASECRSGWFGSAYGWLADDTDGRLHAVWVSFLGDDNFLNHARLADEWLEGTVVEPLAPRDERGDHLPHLVARPEGGHGLRFPNVRSRAHISRFASVPAPLWARLIFRVDTLPDEADMPMAELRVRNARDLALRVAYRPSHGRTIWLMANGGWRDTGVVLYPGRFCTLRIDVSSPVHAAVSVDEQPHTSVYLRSSDPVSDLWIGGNAIAMEDCDVTLLSAEVVTIGAERARSPGEGR